MIKARFILESQGKPTSHVEKSLDNLILQMKKFRRVKLTDEKREKILPVKGTELFSGLVDVGVEMESLEQLFSLVLSTGPSAVILLEPDRIQVNIEELQTVINDLSNLLHSMAADALQSKLALISRR